MTRHDSCGHTHTTKKTWQRFVTVTVPPSFVTRFHSCSRTVTHTSKLGNDLLQSLWRPRSRLVMARAATQTTHNEAMIHYSHRDSLVRDSRRLVHPFTKETKRQGIIYYMHAPLPDLCLVHIHNTHRGNDSLQSPWHPRSRLVMPRAVIHERSLKEITWQSIIHYINVLIRDLWWHMQSHTPSITRQRFFTVTMTPSFVTHDDSCSHTQK